MEYFLTEMLPPGSVVFRGNLTMPSSATIQDHIRVRAEFHRDLKLRCRSLRIRWILHITGDIGQRREAHLDFTAYCDDGDGEQAPSLIREAWKSSGGERATVKPLSDPEFSAWAKYVAKDTAKADKLWRHVPAHNGLNVEGGSYGFWGSGVTMKMVDNAIRRSKRTAQFVAELLPDQVDQWEGFDVSASNTVIALESPKPPPETESKTLSVEDAWRVLAGDCRRAIYSEGSLSEGRYAALASAHPDRVTITELKSTCSPLDADELIRACIRIGLREVEGPIEIDELSERIGIQPKVVSDALAEMPDVRRLSVHVTPDGYLRSDLVA